MWFITLIICILQPADFAFDGDLDDPVRYCREPSDHDMIGTNAGRSNAKPTAGHATQHVFATAGAALVLESPKYRCHSCTGFFL